VTVAEMRDRRRIFDIEAFNRQPIKAEVIPGLEPQQRAPQERPSFGGRGNSGGGGGFGGDRDRKFSNGPREGGFGGNRGGNAGGFGGGRPAAPAGQRDFGGGGFGDKSRDFGGASREGFSYERKGGFNDRFAGRSEGQAAPRGDFQAPRGDFGAPRGDFGAPRGDFAPRKPTLSKPAFGGKPSGFAKPGNGGKVFVPRDAKKRPARNAD
jgi:hypothetical protein